MMIRIRGIEQFSVAAAICVLFWLSVLSFLQFRAGQSLAAIAPWWLIGVLHPAWTISAQTGDCGDFKLALTWLFFLLLLVAFRTAMGSQERQVRSQPPIGSSPLGP